MVDLRLMLWMKTGIKIPRTDSTGINPAVLSMLEERVLQLIVAIHPRKLHVSPLLDSLEMEETN
jgi:hypothetical protein